MNEANEGLNDAEKQSLFPIDFNSIKSNDSWHVPPGSTKPSERNCRIPICATGIILVLLLVTLGLFFTLQRLTKVNEDELFDHSRVRIGPFLYDNGTDCAFEYKCLPGCTLELSREVGCCVGCPIGQANRDQVEPPNCSFNVTVTWANVERLPWRQRIWLFTTIDGKYYYQTGFAPWIENSSNGSSIVPDGCFSRPYQQIALIACLSSEDLQDKSYKGFPVNKCNSTWGLCVATNGIYQDPLDVCTDEGEWEGNFFITEWKGPRAAGSTLSWNFLLILLSFLIANWK